MKRKFYQLRSVFFTLLLSCGIAQGIEAQTLEQYVFNASTGSGWSAAPGNILQYQTTVYAGANGLTNVILTNAIPVGTIYEAGSTMVNNASVSDVNGQMPFASGGAVGTLLPDNTFEIRFRVKIFATGPGNITSYGSLSADNGVALTSNTTSMLLSVDQNCNTFYQVVGATPLGTNNFRGFTTFDPTNGMSIGTFPYGLYENADGTPITTLPVVTNVGAMAYNGQKLYFVNKNTAGNDDDLLALDLTASPLKIVRYTGFKLETTTGAGYNVTRMTNGHNNIVYAITDNGLDFISFYINGITPVITRSGALINDVSNGIHDVLAEASGDIFTDINYVYLIPNSGNVYRIDPATRISTYIGTISNMPAKGCNAVAIGGTGNIFIGGNYNRIYRVSLTNMVATEIGGNRTNGAFATCSFPFQPLRIATNNKASENKPTDNLTVAESSAKVQPNPFHNELNLQVQLKRSETVNIRLIDFFGRTVYSKFEKLNTGINSLNLPVPANLSSGIYVVELWSGNDRLLQKKILKK